MFKYFIITFILFFNLLFANTSTSSALFNEANEALGQYNGEPGGLDIARINLKKLMDIDPKSPDTQIIKAKLIFQDAYISYDNYKKDKLDHVLNICKDVIKTNPQRIETYILYAAALMKSKKQNSLLRAKALLDTASKINPKNIRLLLSYIKIADEYKKSDEVIRLSLEVISLADKKWQKALAYANLTDAYRRKKNYTAAGEAYLKIIELQPSSPWALVNYSSHLRRQKDFDGAITYAKKSLELSNFGMGRKVLSKAYYRKGHQLHWKQKDKINSRKWFQLGVEAYPNSVDCHYGLGASYQHSGWSNRSIADIKRAKKEYQICQNIDPKHKASAKSLVKLEAKFGHLLK